jgi:hypothetical protein
MPGYYLKVPAGTLDCEDAHAPRVSYHKLLWCAASTPRAH